ncbi:hypothetical protein OIO90_003962 [Microbotryomycetes sp. JL221]|nr:hypothetical protein OIO90_003962 [Microbotryomycetes sp. JL221]
MSATSEPHPPRHNNNGSSGNASVSEWAPAAAQHGSTEASSSLSAHATASTSSQPSSSSYYNSSTLEHQDQMYGMNAAPVSSSTRSSGPPPPPPPVTYAAWQQQQQQQQQHGRQHHQHHQQQPMPWENSPYPMYQLHYPIGGSTATAAARGSIATVPQPPLPLIPSFYSTVPPQHHPSNAQAKASSSSSPSPSPQTRSRYAPNMVPSPLSPAYQNAQPQQLLPAFDPASPQHQQRMMPMMAAVPPPQAAFGQVHFHQPYTHAMPPMTSQQYQQYQQQLQQQHYQFYTQQQASYPMSLAYADGYPMSPHISSELNLYDKPHDFERPTTKASSRRKAAHHRPPPVSEAPALAISRDCFNSDAKNLRMRVLSAADFLDKQPPAHSPTIPNVSLQSVHDSDNASESTQLPSSSILAPAADVSSSDVAAVASTAATVASTPSPSSPILTPTSPATTTTTMDDSVAAAAAASHTSSATKTGQTSTTTTTTNSELMTTISTPMTPKSPASTAASTPAGMKRSWADLLRSPAGTGPGSPLVNGHASSSSSSGVNVAAGTSASSKQMGYSTHSSNNFVAKKTLSQLLEGVEHRFSDANIVPRGLINNGNLCFANAILQVLVYCSPFWNLMALLRRETRQDLSGKTPTMDAMMTFLDEFRSTSKVSVVSRRHKSTASGIDQHHSNNNNHNIAPPPIDSFIPTPASEWADPFVPEAVYESLKPNKRFEPMTKGHQEDAEEFLGFFLDTLHDEILYVIDRHDKMNHDDDGSGREDATGSAAAGDDGWLEVGSKGRTATTRTTETRESPITKIFGGQLRSVLRCPGQKDSITLEPYQRLQLEISPDHVRTIEDALLNLTQPEPLPDFVSRSGLRVEATKQVFLETFPPVLILHLKRFMFDNVGGVQKSGKVVGYGTELEIKQDVIGPAKRSGQPVKYQLFGVVYHHGLHATGGHYTVAVRQQLNSHSWLHIDDTQIRPISPADVAVGREGAHGSDNEKSAYLLFPATPFRCCFRAQATFSKEMTDAVRIVNGVLPTSLDGPVEDYIASLFDSSEPDPTDDPIAHFIHPLLESEHVNEQDIERVCSQLQSLWEEQTGRISDKGPAKLDKVVDMRRQEAISKRQTVTQVVDISSVVKARETQVNLKALEKAEAKIAAKIAKRDRKTAYESSKLIDANKGQKSYEELFLEVNPLQAPGTAKGKSKDIHLDNIDLSFGSLRILSNATVTLPYGRRAGLIGRNGIGKSTLLRAMALRELNIPQHISILYVQQEVTGDDTKAIDSVLSADVHRTRLLAEEQELNSQLESIEKKDNELTEEQRTRQAEELSTRLGEVQTLLVEIDAYTGPSRAAELLAGLGFSTSDQQMPTKSFSGGWRMRLSLARALFCKPDLLLLDEPSNNLDLNALAWLEDYLQTWPSTLLVVSHDRSFLDAVATDIIYQHNERLDYYKGNFTQFYATKSERAKNQKREYEAQLQYRQHLQAFVDRWRYNANRAAQAQSRLKILESLPELTPPEDDDVVTFRFETADKISPPHLQLSDVNFGYDKQKPLLSNVNIDVGLDSRIGLIGANGAGKSTLMKLLIGELSPTKGNQVRNGRLRIAYFAQHHIDSLDLGINSVAWLAKQFPGKSEQEYRSHLGAFGITGTTSLQLIGTLSGGQKSRVSFATLSMQHPHILLLDEPTNHLDIEGLDALMNALNSWNGGVIVISHDSTFINTVCKELWVVGDGKAEKFYGDVDQYKNIIITNAKTKPT